MMPLTRGGRISKQKAGTVPRSGFCLPASEFQFSEFQLLEGVPKVFAKGSTDGGYADTSGGVVLASLS
jgi:hypothetical protein